MLQKHCNKVDQNNKEEHRFMHLIQSVERVPIGELMTRGELVGVIDVVERRRLSCCYWWCLRR